VLPKDLKKAVLYYKKAMQSKHSYASYRFAMCMIRGELNKNGQNKEDIKEAHNILMKIATGADACP
jgi:TPR repeat protein